MDVRSVVIALLIAGVAASGCGDSAPAVSQSQSCIDNDPCQNGGLCMDVGGRAVCDCSGTGFSGETCDDQSSMPSGCRTQNLPSNQMCFENGTLGFCTNGECI